METENKIRVIKKIKFWKSKSNNGNYLIDSGLLLTFLEENGFRKYKNISICLRDNIGYSITDNEMFNFCHEFVKSRENSTLLDCFMKQGNRIFIQKFGVLTTLKECEYDLLRDTKEITYIPFSNTIVSVTKNRINLISYTDLKNKFVLNENLIERNFYQVEEVSVIEEFVNCISFCSKSKECIMSSIGYLLSNFKDPRNPKAIILTDFLSQSKEAAEGGSGKGLIVQAIKQMKINVVTENGKNLNLESSFAYQSVSLNTKVFFLDDIKKGFDFEYLFSITTNDFKVEQKGKQAFKIPYVDSPKILIATNYPIKGNESSFNRRKHTVLLRNFFNDKNTPFIYFNHTFFEDWNLNEFNRFDNFMIQCAMLFLERGLILFENDEVKKKMIKDHIPNEVFERLEACEINKVLKIKNLGLSNTLGVNEYAEYKGLEVKKSISSGNTTIKFTEPFNNTK